MNLKWPAPNKAQRQALLFLQLTEEQQEAFMSLVPEWFGTLDELFEAVVILYPSAGTGE
jgi:hypothetical protein